MGAYGPFQNHQVKTPIGMVSVADMDAWLIVGILDNLRRRKGPNDIFVIRLYDDS
jgi:hypothetical protein